MTRKLPGTDWFDLRHLLEGDTNSSLMAGVVRKCPAVLQRPHGYEIEENEDLYMVKTQHSIKMFDITCL